MNKMSIHIRGIKNGYILEDYGIGESHYEKDIDGVVAFLLKFKLKKSDRDEVVEFDIMPKHFPPLPKGFVFFGQKPIYKTVQFWIIEEEKRSCIAIMRDNKWITGFSGDGKRDHYAVKRGTQVHKDAISAFRKGKPI